MCVCVFCCRNLRVHHYVTLTLVRVVGWVAHACASLCSGKWQPKTDVKTWLSLLGMKVYTNLEMTRDWKCVGLISFSLEYTRCWLMAAIFFWWQTLIEDQCFENWVTILKADLTLYEWLIARWVPSFVSHFFHLLSPLSGNNQRWWCDSLATSTSTKLRLRSHWQWQRHKLRTGSLRNDDGNSNVNATNQWFDWLNEEKKSCCTCDTLFQ